MKDHKRLFPGLCELNPGTPAINGREMAYAKDIPFDVLAMHAERHGYLLAKVAADGGLSLSGEEERLTAAHERIKARTWRERTRRR